MGFSLKRAFKHPFGKHSLFHGATKIIGKAAPIVAPFIPGIGPIAAGAIAAGGSLIGGKKPLSALKAGLLSYGGAKLLGGKGIGAFGKKGGGAGSILDRAKNLVLGKESFTYQGAGPRTGGLLGSGGLLSRASKSVGGPLNLAQLGLAGANALQAARSGGQADAALNRALNPPRVNLSQEFADPNNPYATSGVRVPRARRAASLALSGGY